MSIESSDWLAIFSCLSLARSLAGGRDVRSANLLSNRSRTHTHSHTLSHTRIRTHTLAHSRTHAGWVPSCACDMCVSILSVSLVHLDDVRLWLGGRRTKKFPKENAYSSFLSQHGGFCNAFTSSHDTNFYFDVSHPSVFFLSSFPSALFSLIAPADRGVLLAGIWRGRLIGSRSSSTSRSSTRT